MKLSQLQIAACAILLLTSGLMAQLGPDVAVMEIQFGKEKERERVVIGLYDTTTPATVQSFKELIGKKFYNNMRFHRAFPNSLVQTGDPASRRGDSSQSGTGGPGYTIPAEINKPTVRGAVATARLGDRVNPAKASNGSQFFVCLEPMPKISKQYTVFGEILEGMDVLERVSNARTDSNDFPIEKIVIRKVTLEPRLPAAPAPTTN